MQETQIATTKGVIYGDSRAHVVFDDGSALVLHPGGQFVTYFSASGQVLRQVTSCATYEVKERLLLALELYNSLAETPIGIYGDLLYPVQRKDVKLTYFHWTLPNCISVLDNRNSRELRRFSLSEGTEEEDLKLLRVFRSSDGAFTVESLEQEARVTLSSNGMLLKVVFPMLLPSKTTQWLEKQGTVKLAYEYATLTQVYSTAATPPIWQPVLKLLWLCFLDEGSPVLREPNWLETEDVMCVGVGELATPVPSAGQGLVWSHDTVSPAVSVFNYFQAPVKSVWTPEATYHRTLTDELEVTVHQDQAVLQCSASASRLVFRHYSETEPLCFTDETVPPLIRTGESEYSLDCIVDTCKEVLSLPVKTPTEVWEDEDISADGTKCESEHEGVGLFTAYNDGSVRVLFEDRTVVRLYRDMTISAISRQGQMSKMSLDNPFGFETYIPIVLEFYEWVFTSPEQQAAKRQAKEVRDRLINAETQRIERLLRPPVESCEGGGVYVSEEVAAELAETERCLRELSDFLA
jgi:hypothetical protein